MTWLIVALYGLSAALELGGVVVTVVDIREYAKRVQDYQARGIMLPLRATGRAVSSGTAELSGGTPAANEQRVQALEQAVGGLREGMRTLQSTMRDELNESLRGLVEDVQTEWRQRFDALKDRQGEPPQGWLRRYLGPGLVAIGILAGATAGILSTHGVVSVRFQVPVTAW